MKKTIFIILGIMAVAAAAYFIFFFTAKVTIIPNPNNAQVEINGKTFTGETHISLMPGKHRLKITLTGYISYDQDIITKASKNMRIEVDLRQVPKTQKLSDGQADFPALTQDNKSLLFLTNNGKTVYKLDNILSDKKQTAYAITPENFSQVGDIIWQPQKLLSIIKKINGNTSLYDFGRYDLLNQESFDWGQGIKGIAWKSDGEQVIYYFAPDSGEKSIIRASKDNSNMERIFDMRPYNLTDAKVYWSQNSQKILLVAGQVYVFDLYTRSLNKIEGIANVSNANFTADSQKIIYGKNAGLWIMDLDGKNNTDLAIKTNLSKMAWIDEANFIFAESNPGKSDDLIKFNLLNKDQTSYQFSSDTIINATSLIIEPTYKKLFFTSNNYLYSVILESQQY